MQDYVVRYRRKPKSWKGAMICGLPDSGFVAKIAVDHLIEQMKPKTLAEIYSPHLPPQVLIRENGLVEPMSHKVYYSAKQRFFIYTGDSQPVDPEGAHALSELVVDLAKKYSVSELVILAAMIKGSPVEQPKVFVSATDEKLANEYSSLGAQKTSLGTITWMHGLILGEALKRGVKAVCLSSETQGDLPDPAAAEVALKMVEKRFGVKMDTSKLKEKKPRLEGVTVEMPQRPEYLPRDRRKEPSYIG